MTKEEIQQAYNTNASILGHQMLQVWNHLMKSIHLDNEMAELLKKEAQEHKAEPKA